MTADRLHQAADFLDHCTHPDSLVYETPRVSRQDNATADLLRAVADWHNHVTIPGESQGICVPCQMVWPCTQAGAALALADVILGGSDD